MIYFTDEQKIKYFDEIFEKFYKRNFGLASKSEIDLLLFKFYYDTFSDCEESSKHKISDYTISKELGITQTRVRNMRIKKELVYPHIDVNWKGKFLEIVPSAHFDRNTHKVTINIGDPNIFLELENYIDVHNMYFEKQLNQKNFTLRVEYFIELLISIDDSVDENDVTKRLKDKILKYDELTKPIYKDSLGKIMIEKSLDASSLLANIATIVPALLNFVQFLN
ncbi:hypothetical protein [Enterococcus sp. AZ046]|uniref:hypothetical protein n=1 Tax=Enterococcus sp. AZ046 TaxID=2774685 RepID=UPI003D2DC5D9